MQSQNEPATGFSLHKIFLGRHGLRAGWSALVFAGLLVFTVLVISTLLAQLLHGTPPPDPHRLTPFFGLINEVVIGGAWLVAAFVMSRIEEKPLLSYNYAGPHRFARFLCGLFWGFACASALILTLYKLGDLAFDAAPVFNSTALLYAAQWAFVFLCTAFAEESIMRGYLQSTLTRGIGFWWSAILLSAAFGLLHLGNSGESPIGIFGAAAIGLLFCLSLWYTGSLWWAIGFHAAWDWAESFFYGTADSGTVSLGRLYSMHPTGSTLMSGGSAGPEASLLLLPLQLLIALAMVLWWRSRTTSPFAASAFKPAPADPPPSASTQSF